MFFCSASNTGMHRRQITDLLDQSIQVHSQCFVITSDNRYILVCGFWDKSFRVYSTDSGNVFFKWGSSLKVFFSVCNQPTVSNKGWGGERVFIPLLIFIKSFLTYCCLVLCAIIFVEWWQMWEKKLLFRLSFTSNLQDKDACSCTVVFTGESLCEALHTRRVNYS